MWVAKHWRLCINARPFIIYSWIDAYLHNMYLHDAIIISPLGSTYVLAVSIITFPLVIPPPMRSPRFPHTIQQKDPPFAHYKRAHYTKVTS